MDQFTGSGAVSQQHAFDVAALERRVEATMAVFDRALQAHPRHTALLCNRGNVCGGIITRVDAVRRDMARPLPSAKTAVGMRQAKQGGHRASQCV